MKGKIVEAQYAWKDNPDNILLGWFAINCEELPGWIDNNITFYFESEEEFEKAQDDFSNDFKIIGAIK